MSRSNIEIEIPRMRPTLKKMWHFDTVVFPFWPMDSHDMDIFHEFFVTNVRAPKKHILLRHSTVADRYSPIAFLNCTEQGRISDGSTKLPEVWATSTCFLIAQCTAHTHTVRAVCLHQWYWTNYFGTTVTIWNYLTTERMDQWQLDFVHEVIRGTHKLTWTSGFETYKIFWGEHANFNMSTDLYQVSSSFRIPDKIFDCRD